MRRYGDKPSDMLIKLEANKCQERSIEMNIRTPREAYLTGSISISRLSKVYGRKSVNMLISLWINNFVEFTAVTVNSKAEDFIECASLMYAEAPYMTVSEYALFFMRCKKGHYGQFYGRFEPQKLLSWLDEYLNERMDAYRKIQKKADRIRRDLCWNGTSSRNSAISSLMDSMLPVAKVK